MGFDADIIVALEYACEVRAPPFVNLVRRGRDLQAAAAAVVTGRAPAPTRALYAPIETKQELGELIDKLAPDDVIITGVPNLGWPVLPNREELEDMDDDDVGGACHGGDIESGIRELVLFKTNELDKLLDSILPPNHRLMFLWDSVGEDDPLECYMRIAVRGAETTAVRSLRGWKHADEWENAIRVVDVRAPTDVVGIARSEKVKIDALPALSMEEEAQARSDMANVVKLFGLEAVGTPAWKVMVKHYGG
jgi:hypothetical protein